MAFKDLFLPKLVHSNPEKRKEAVRKERSIDILQRVIEKDENPEVVNLAKLRISQLKPEQDRVRETD